jgi:Bacteriophage T4-like portal protein (Gp20)
LKIFGFEIKREGEEAEDRIVSFAEPSNDDGAITVTGNALGGFYSTLLDMEGAAKTESELVTKYRSIAQQPEIAQAVEEITNEAINIDSDEEVVEIILDDTELPDKVKNKIIDEFEEILTLLDFSSQAYDIFSKFYVDGRLNYHVIIDNENIKEGIKELRYVDPRKLKLIRELDKKNKDPHSGIPVKKVKNEYYMYSENGFGSDTGTQQSSTQGFRIAKDSIARVTSGLMNENNSLVLSYLHPSIKPLNQLRMLEDATIIYTLTRAPERRIFYIDVGNLPKSKAEQYLRDMMIRHKNKLQYNSSTGEITDARKMMTMTEDFWFPRRGGERSTEVDVLPGGSAQALSSDENLQYFQRKLFNALKVPLSRLQPETMATFGRVSEITRDELKFSKFVRRLRSRFSNIFTQLLEKQLVLKGIMLPEEFAEIKNMIRYDFIVDNYFEELKEAEIIRERMETLRQTEDTVGVYYSREWVRKNVLRMNEEDIKEMKKQIEKEKSEEPPEEVGPPDQGQPPQFQQQQPQQAPEESKVING